jgi:hypothetical protein
VTHHSAEAKLADGSSRSAAYGKLRALDSTAKK